jgi:predicted O-methyltransferase YrrM
MDRKYRKSRFHDEKGNLIPFMRLIKNGMKALYSFILLKLFNRRPILPWISYDAIVALKKIIRKNHIILEFGSGYSTLWLSGIAGKVYSVEDNPEWYKILSDQIKRRGIDNIQLFYRNKEEFANFPDEIMNTPDMILVDGSNRGECMAKAITRIAPDGIIYLDNSDKGMHDDDDFNNEYRNAEKILLDFAHDREAEISYYTDFSPTSLFVQQGLMVILKKYK